MRSKCDYEAGRRYDEGGVWVRESSPILRVDSTMALCQFVLDVQSLLLCRNISVVTIENTRSTSLLYLHRSLLRHLPKIVLLHLNISLQISK